VVRRSAGAEAGRLPGRTLGAEPSGAACPAPSEGAEPVEGQCPFGGVIVTPVTTRHWALRPAGRAGVRAALAALVASRVAVHGLGSPQ
jgi:hypothetical protein